MGSESEKERKPEVPASTRDEALFPTVVFLEHQTPGKHVSVNLQASGQSRAVWEFGRPRGRYEVQMMNHLQQAKGQGGLACYDSWGRKESDKTERLNLPMNIQD